MGVLRPYVGGNYMRHHNSALAHLFKTGPGVWAYRGDHQLSTVFRTKDLPLSGLAAVQGRHGLPQHAADAFGSGGIEGAGV